MEAPLHRSRRSTRVWLALALIVVGACSGSAQSNADDEGVVDEDTADDEVAAEHADDTSGNDQGDGAEGSTAGEGDAATERSVAELPLAPLGFESAVFDVPVPTERAGDSGAFRDANELIDAGIAAGVWSEIDGVRAIVSVVMGERRPESVPALNELPRFHYREVIDRGIVLLDDPSVDGEAAADLARLLAFFTADRLTFVDTEADETAAGDVVEGASGAGGVALAGLRSPEARQACFRPQEVVLFAAAATDPAVCYDRFEDGDDVVMIARHEDAIDVSELIFDVIRRARPGYVTLAGQELQPVEVLVSIDPSPPDGADPEGTSLAHIASASTNVCRVAMFASNTLETGTPHLEFTIAHELFHCIQKLWSGARPHQFVEEAGPDYFAYEVLGKLCTDPQRSLGSDLDGLTATGSLLDATYEGWFFWAFLAEHGHQSPQQIATLHEAVYQGAAIEASLLQAIDDAPTVLNEFFVRLVGPGLACGFQGERFTRPVTIDQRGAVELGVSSVWHGTRYQLAYAKEKLFEQHADAGPIGMADFFDRSAADEWVTTEPEVRSTCTDVEKWMVVVSPPEVGTSSAPRVLQVDAVKPGGCDPCVIGSWSMDIQSFEDYMETLAQGQELDIAGTYTMRFGYGPPEGGMEYSDERSIEISFPATGSAYAVRLEGAGSGTYSTADGRLESQGYTESGVASATGVPIDVGVPFANTGDSGVPYTCEGDVIMIDVNGNPLYLTRMPASPQGPRYFG